MKNIYLVGMPGSGKSTLGRLLSDKTSRRFLDTDEEIKRITGASPDKIITLQGEDKLREIEKVIVNELICTEGMVVATGGGLPVFHENMKLMNRHGITVYIRYKAETLWNRMENDRIRPLSSTLKATESLLSLRERIYDDAHIIIHGDEAVESNLCSILSAIREKFPSEL